MCSVKVISLWILLTTLGSFCQGDLDLYMNSTETRRLLGIVGELYYVRMGIINNYALSFNLPIKSQVKDIYFTWRNLRGAPPDMYYKMSLSNSNTRALKDPKPSIAMEGAVPTKVTAFKVTLECTGLVNAEVDVVLQMNISIFSASNLTTLNIKRKKTCLKGNVNELEGDHNHKIIMPDPADLNVSYTFPDKNKQAASPGGFLSTSTNIFYMALGCVCAIVVLVAFIVLIHYFRSQKSNRNERMSCFCCSETSSSQALSHSGHTYLRADTPNNSVATYGGVRRIFTPILEPNPTEVRSMLKEIHIDRNSLTLGDVLIEGAFGRVYHGTLLLEDEKDLASEQDVIVKTVREQVRADQVEKMLKEAVLMKGMCHQNINPIVRACIQDPSQPFLIFPFATEGNLKKFLQSCKMADITSRYGLNTLQLVYMAIQIVRGVQYLHRKRVLHKDIATRNCVVDNQLTVRITDTALSRDLFPMDYHCLGDNENRPVKWLALESLLQRQFSPASDVWMFGVTLWELMTLGQQPYADVDPFEMATYLREGFRISQPLNCPDELFAVMACCWGLNPDERPKFSQLQVCLQDFYAALGRFV
uniref:receptor protein-tyrosine kinase n=1 Tax=Platynereis dumerilii TaxID=6359 RepID=A0A1B1M0P1_PLADU|nr:tyrosine-protein kinase Ryk [Platynereis dumerilii]